MKLLEIISLAPPTITPSQQWPPWLASSTITTKLAKEHESACWLANARSESERQSAAIMQALDERIHRYLAYDDLLETNNIALLETPEETRERREKTEMMRRMLAIRHRQRAERERRG
ncbi:hypothetical protein HYALB_00011841 [Hymenoscyphus albidus]|uniref:Uncharacterized protein n=1 Tax=Hymenoscyphus albidus TaxID=595503 RepID=A0A9N9PYX7_9HELO|nr:hypothetical protein HYALB_00011841 [Hymenoscyphus albidus]